MMLGYQIIDEFAGRQDGSKRFHVKNKTSSKSTGKSGDASKEQLVDDDCLSISSKDEQRLAIDYHKIKYRNSEP